ncbi:MAG: hypothetical protein BroJett014_19730 [Planctomycetota bacterium]|nr:hypothetical protein [Planctomycetota bacterium]GIK53000.1 MAG: hypothetical protein BroJett014_19730 [Planctomycetota bacterium]
MAIFGPHLARSTPLTSGEGLLRHLAAQNRRIDTAAAQLSSGRRIGSLSFDPQGAAAWLSLESLQRRNVQFNRNAEDLRQRYNLADSQLSEAGDILSRLKGLALRESNASADAQTRANSAREVAALRQALLDVANASHGGQSLFGGPGAAFTALGKAVRLGGRQAPNRVEVGPGVSLENSLRAEEVFGPTMTLAGRDLNARASLGDVTPVGARLAATPLSALNHGAGVDSAGRLLIDVIPDAGTGARMSYSLDLSHARTIEDVVVALNNLRDASGAQLFSAGLETAASTGLPQGSQSAASFIRLAVFPGGPLDGGALSPNARIVIADEPGRTTARDLGLSTAAFSHLFQSEDLSALAPFAGPINFNMQANGQTLPLSVSPAAPGGLTELAAALDAAISATLAGASIGNMSVTVSANTGNGTLQFFVSDSGGAGYFALEATNDAAADLRLHRGTSLAGPGYLSGAAAFSTDEALLGRDLTPASFILTRLSDLFGGAGLRLETDAAGLPRSPQGLRIQNGDLSAVIDLKQLIEDPAATLHDLAAAISRAGVEVDARLAPNGRHIELVSRLWGAALSVEDFNGTLASQLGLTRNLPDAQSADLNAGRGIDNIPGADFTLISSGGHPVPVDLAQARTTREIAAAINAAADNVNPSGGRYFTAAALRRREFDSAVVTSPAAAFNFSVSFNGEPARSISVPALGGRTLTQLAGEMEQALARAARQSGLDGLTVYVRAHTGGFLQLRIEDESGLARAGFSGPDAAALGLGGTASAQGEVRLLNEQSSERLVVRDHTFITATYQPGGPQPLAQQTPGASTADDLGLGGSFDVTTGRFEGRDLAPRAMRSDGAFDVLAELQQALEGNQPALVARAMEKLDVALNRVLDQRAEAGARSQRLELAQGRIEAENTSLAGLSAEVMETDLAKAASDFQQAQLVLNAGLQVTAQISRVSVLDYL